ncbi:hypothetical protein [Haloarchaeobius sp. TZWWS8]|uniref:hypothetical protein n=1 Tax=Haloarchaeobius sp. TZWWS8 TaxID=3446121 RepID=UPI003EBB1C38
MRETAASSSEQDEPTYDWTRTDDGVRIFDPENQDAWVQMSFEAGVPPEKRLFMICDDCGAVAAQRTRPGTVSVCGSCDTAFEAE